MPATAPVMKQEEMYELIGKISASFSPSVPVDHKALFAGRIEQMMSMLNAINQRGQHVIVYGERGVGKTSLASVVARISSGSHLATISPLNCDATMDYTSLWRRALREVPISKQLPAGIGFTTEPTQGNGTLADLLPAGVLTPDEIRHFLQRIGHRTMIVLDEIDRITDKDTKTQLADTIKNLSDHAVPTTLVMVGVADTVESLIGEHLSIERALVQIRMPRMTKSELQEIIHKGAANATMSIIDDARDQIVGLAQGLPHYVHLLSLHAFQAAVQRGSKTVTVEDVKQAISKALKQAHQSTIAAYHRATNSPRENLYPQVLLACAMALPDDVGYFAAADVRAPLSTIMGRTYDINAFSQHLNAFCDAERGPVLQRMGTPRRFRFRFINPLMQPYVIMHGVDRGLVKDLH